MNAKYRMSDFNIFEKLIETPPFSLKKAEKGAILTEALSGLSRHHYENCIQYRNMMRAYGFNPATGLKSYADVPPLPVRLFKELSLKSVPDSELFKTLTSSGTTGQDVSKIYLDRAAAGLQQKVLAKIVSDFTGSGRMPMLIIDSASVIKSRSVFSARGAGILGFSIFGSDKAYALDDDMQIDVAAIEAFLEKHSGKRLFMFGFTFMIWQHFYKELLKSDRKLDLSNAVLIHGGGWKKLSSESVSPREFKKRLNDVCGVSSVHDYYGMAEQTGTVYVECEHGHLHASVFSDIITRRSVDLSVCEIGEEGIIETVSVLPKSYPGHALLTEDAGVVLGEDDCPCGRYGKYFKVIGRMAKAELRGCGDTYASSF